MTVLRLLWMIFVFVVMEGCSYNLKVDALEATFTHADGEEGRPLPLSQNLRDQISQLDQIISSSENPQETLMKVAQSNNMDPNELVQMINSNRRDQALTHVKSSSLPRKLLANTFQLLFVMPFRTISLRYWIILLAAIFISIQAPRTGIPLSSSLAGGWTTVFEPPTPYLHSSMEKHYEALFDQSSSIDDTTIVSQRLQALLELQNSCSPTNSTKKKKKKQTKKKTARHNNDGVQLYNDLDISMNNEQDSTDSKKKKKKGKKKKSDASITQDVICAKYNVDIKDLISILDKDNTQSDEETQQVNVHVAISQIMTAAKSVLSGRRFSEYVSPSHKTSITTSQNDEDAAVWVLPQMGMLNRFAIQPFVLISEHVDENSSASIDKIEESCYVSYASNNHVGNKFSVFDDGAQLDICCTWTKDDDVQVRVTLAFPNDSDMIVSDPKKVQLVSKSIDELGQSISKSIALQAKQNLSRRMQSRSFRANAQARALEKRSIRQAKLIALEEMNEIRRRRWQRNNPDSGHYRPSGIRMQSPNNC